MQFANQFAGQFNPDDPRWTAYVLGELDADSDAADLADLAELEQQLENSPAARQYVDELRQTIGLLSAELETEPVMQLTAEQRSAIQRELCTPAQPTKVVPVNAVHAMRQADLVNRTLAGHTRANRTLGMLVAVAASLLVVATLSCPASCNRVPVASRPVAQRAAANGLTSCAAGLW